MSAAQPRNDESPQAQRNMAEPAAAGVATLAEREEARSEVYEYLHVREQRRQMFPRAALVGLLAGLVATAFRLALAAGDDVRNRLIDWAYQYAPLGIIFPILFGLVGAVLAVFLMRRYAPETSGSGIPHLEAVLRRYREMDWRRILPVKFAGGLAALSGGMALCREGPTVQMGGAAGDLVSRWLKVSARERFTLIAAGGFLALRADCVEPDQNVPYEITPLISQGDMICAEWTLMGTQQGPLPGPGGRIEPTGKPIHVPGCFVFRVADGKVSEYVGHVDFLGMYRQLGAVAPLSSDVGRPAA